MKELLFRFSGEAPPMQAAQILARESHLSYKVSGRKVKIIFLVIIPVGTIICQRCHPSLCTILKLFSPLPRESMKDRALHLTWLSNGDFTFLRQQCGRQTLRYSGFAHSRTLIYGCWGRLEWWWCQHNCFKLSLEAKMEALILKTDGPHGPHLLIP